MRKIQFGCGSNILNGWENHDADIDIRNPLPFEDCSVDIVFTEHLIEHVTHQEAYKFLEECYRILKFKGIIRMAFPDVCRIYHTISSDYIRWVGGKKELVTNILFKHGHQTLWTTSIMITVLKSIGFKSVETSLVGLSHLIEDNTEGHHKQIGKEFNYIETSVVEGIK